VNGKLICNGRVLEVGDALRREQKREDVAILAGLARAGQPTAASMKNALDEVNALFTNCSGIKVVASYAASSALMKQIEQGAPADVFLSADVDWMDYGAKHNLIKNDSRENLLGNRLVLIAPKDSKIDKVSIEQGFDLAGLVGNGRIATGDVRSVPAGLYAKAALENLGVWSSVESKLAMAENVRAALVLVARQEAPLLIVYETDAKVDPGVKIVGVFPEDSRACRGCPKGWPQTRQPTVHPRQPPPDWPSHA
jgi:molybdate transport system substrate-binding protein